MSSSPPPSLPHTHCTGSTTQLYSDPPTLNRGETQEQIQERPAQYVHIHSLFCTYIESTYNLGVLHLCMVIAHIIDHDLLEYGICPFLLSTDPHSAVRLADTGVPGSTYINANYIRVRLPHSHIECIHLIPLKPT